MTTASTSHAPIGKWSAEVTFLEGPREGEKEPVLLTFLSDGVIIHADRIPVGSGQLARGIGEWSSEGERFHYWFNVVLNQPSGRPENVVYVHGEGTLAGDGQTFAASGGSEAYSSTGQPVVAHRTVVVGTRERTA